MKEPQDPLEAELSALRPQSISDELRRRIAGRLSEPVPARRRWLWRSVVAGGLTAACLAAFVRSWIDRDNVEVPPEVVRLQPIAGDAVAFSFPTLMVYQHALARSPEELEALLGKHARMSSESDSQLVRVGVFVRSDAALHALLGDD